MRPMLATPGDPNAGPPAGAGWVHEIKWDGIRLLVQTRSGRVHAWTRSGRDIAHALPELTGLASLAENLLLDGEAVVMASGRPSFAHVVERVHLSSAAAAASVAATRPVTYLAFDLLSVDGLDLTPLSWTDRRHALEELLPPLPSLQLSPIYDDGPGLLDITAEQRLEGVVSKRREAPYLPGVRSTSWLKFPHRLLTSVVIGGWRAQSGTDSRLGALHVGLPALGADGSVATGADGAPRLHYLGRVGSGLAGRAGDLVQSQLRGLEIEHSPFVEQVPRIDAQGSLWVRPQVVVAVASLGLAAQGRLRQPSYQGLRPDLDPRDVLESELYPSADHEQEEPR